MMSATLLGNSTSVWLPNRESAKRVIQAQKHSPKDTRENACWWWHTGTQWYPWAANADFLSIFPDPSLTNRRSGLLRCLGGDVQRCITTVAWITGRLVCYWLHSYYDILDYIKSLCVDNTWQLFNKHRDCVHDEGAVHINTNSNRSRDCGQVIYQIGVAVWLWRRKQRFLYFVSPHDNRAGIEAQREADIHATIQKFDISTLYRVCKLHGTMMLRCLRDTLTHSKLDLKSIFWSLWLIIETSSSCRVEVYHMTIQLYVTRRREIQQGAGGGKDVRSIALNHAKFGYGQLYDSLADHHAVVDTNNLNILRKYTYAD